ncbi:unnamed protein product [Mycena citricolor]|uniref:Transcription factor tau subunit sfc6 n=1 Tax=Mycena citricolor TaxID=2018698 RepID=A0AAD2HZV1_9AGAR|nr:unnamed protein product [Mycena citricolor]
MPRALRPRKSQPNYAALLDLGEDETEAGPSRRAVVEDVDSGSDFAPENAPTGDDPGGAEEAYDSADDEPMDADEEEAELEELGDASSKVKSRARIQATQTARTKRDSVNQPRVGAGKGVLLPSLGGGSGIARTSKRQIFAVPTPTVNQRHRAVPLFSRIGRVERLTQKPDLFGPSHTTSTNNFTQSAAVTKRIHKGLALNVGAGPIWQLIEDRGWYKEEVIGDGEFQVDAQRRPVMHRDIRVKTGLSILTREEVELFLPTDTVTTVDGKLKPPPPISCLMGPFGKQVPVQIDMFQSRNNSEWFPESKSHIFNPGAPAWGLDWCPIHSDDRAARDYTQYLAVAPFPTRLHSPDIGVKAVHPSPACIQIWTLSPTHPDRPTSEDAGELRCAMVLCVDCGPAHELKWCPLPSHDSALDKDQATPRKLGLLGGTFEDGSFCVFVVPDPADVTPVGHDLSAPVFVRLPEPIIRIDLEETSCFTFDWANSELIAIGTTHGTLAVFHLGQVLKNCAGSNPALAQRVLPSHYLTIHQSAIRALTWIRAPPSLATGEPRTDGDPTVIATGGYDGLECLTDIRDGHGSIMNRTRDVVNCMTYSAFASGPITIDHENIIKAYSVSPSLLGRGHTLIEPEGPSVHASDFHPQLAIGSADGVCSTTNMLRSNRRSGSVPFFVHKIYQLDYNRKTEEFRMLEHFLPLEAQDRPTQTKMKTEKAAAKQNNLITPVGTGVWPREVGVHKVVWNSGNGLGSAPLLASATGCGLCRIDVVWGRWLNDNTPYYSVADLRLDGNRAAMDADSDDSE